MQVSCGNCQLSFDAPEGATGLVCPICRGPLLPKSADGAAPATKATQDWNGGDLDDLIAILSAPALSARVEVLGASGDTAIGEVHLLAGGVSDALHGGKSTDDALDKLRAAKPTRFRVEQRLPNPADGDLTYPGPESGTLESRALAHLMRYSEDYVITCAIEVWRGNENARVEYKRGEIGNVTVGGIDAPERLAEVMKWSSGNYRLVVPPIKLPAVAPKRPQAAAAAPAKVPAPAPSAQAARQSSSTKTIFGMPAAEIIKARAAAEAAKAAAAAAAAAAAPARTTAPTSPATPAAQPPAASAAPPPAASAAAPPPAATPAPARVSPPGVAPSAVPAPVSRSSGSSATKTIFGVPTPGSLGGFTQVTQPSVAAAPAPAASAPAADDRGKTGARKVSVPGPEVAPAQAGANDDPAATHSGYGSTPAAEAPRRTATPAPVARPAPAPAPAAAAEKTHTIRRETPIWTYVGVGVAFGLALIGIWQLVGVLAH